MIFESFCYLYDGSMEGFLTVIFSIYEKKRSPSRILSQENVQLVFGEQEILIETDKEKALRVQKKIIQKAGLASWRKIFTGFLSANLEKEMNLYTYIARLLKIGPSILQNLSNPTVIEVEKLNKHVFREFEKWIGFLRFSILKKNIYYASYKPIDNVTPLLMPHFVDRFSTHPFLIHDQNRGLVGLSDTNTWYLIDTSSYDLSDLNLKVDEFEEIWNTFYAAIANPERKNLNLQRNLLPKRYRENMPEFYPKEYYSFLKQK